MSEFRIEHVRGEDRPGELKYINDKFPKFFLPLDEERHLKRGFWWLAYFGCDVVGFAGTVPFEPFARTGYFKRVAVIEAHRGKGLSTTLTKLTIAHAKKHTDWLQMVSECSSDNYSSANNLIRSGFSLCGAERPWAKKTLFWTMRL